MIFAVPCAAISKPATGSGSAGALPDPEPTSGACSPLACSPVNGPLASNRLFTRRPALGRNGCHGGQAHQRDEREAQRSPPADSESAPAGDDVHQG